MGKLWCNEELAARAKAGNKEAFALLWAQNTIPTADRTVSVDPDVIPLGTVLIIDGHEYIAEDTGSAVKGNVIDIYFDSHELAVEYGVQMKTIYIKGD